MSDNFVRYAKSSNLIDKIFQFCEKNNIKLVRNYDIKLANYSNNVQTYYESLNEELIENIIDMVREYDNNSR